MKVLFYTSDKGGLESEILFRQEVIKASGVEVYPFGKGYSNNEYRGISISEKIESVGGVDVILFSLFWKMRYADCFDKSKALKVSVASDFYEGAYRIDVYKRHYKARKFDIVFGNSTIVMNYLKKEGVGKKRYHLPFGVDTKVFRKYDVEKYIDVLASYTTMTFMPDVYPYRIKIWEILARMSVSVYIQRLCFNCLPEVTSASKIVVNSNARYNFINPRITETLACGSFLLTSYCDDLAKFGYRDYEHLVTFKDMDDFTDKVKYFLKNDKEREEIAKNGMKFVRNRYSNKKRVETMFDKISNHL